jgi:hypothetical protein
MPTPFTHLANARRLLNDAALPASIRAALRAHESAFLLGTIAADGHMLAGLRRDQTHFYRYDALVDAHPWRIMFTEYPALHTADDPDARAFLAGYIAHLCLDEIWWLHLTRPEFGLREWGTRDSRFLLLNVLLIQMDERDEAAARTMGMTLAAAHPRGWLPFMDDVALAGWRDVVARQLMPDGISETLPIIAPRVGLTAGNLRALIDDAPRLERELYAHVPRARIAEVEIEMDAHARDQVRIYWEESAAIDNFN